MDHRNPNSILNTKPGDFIPKVDIPGIKVTPKGIMNAKIKDIICALLFGGIKNMLKGPLLCVTADLEKLIGEPNDIPSIAELQKELSDLHKEVKRMEGVMDVKETIGRVNKAMGEVQSLLSLGGMCKSPLRIPRIPNILDSIIDSEFAMAKAILNEIGRLTKPQLCLTGQGGLTTGTYNPKSILGRIGKLGGRMADIPGNQIDSFTKQIKAVGKSVKKINDIKLFPDFRHKHNLVTGKPYAGEASVVTLAAPPPVESQWNPPYPPTATPNLQEATESANALVNNINSTASYPSISNGIKYPNAWQGLVGPEIYAMAVDALTPEDPLFVRQDPVYDYCGKIVGYSANIITGDPYADGDDPAADADQDPVQDRYNFVWIKDRNCWAVSDVMSEQIVAGRKAEYLTPNPTIQIHRDHGFRFGIPSMDLLANEVAPEFYLYKVNSNLAPDITKKFNLGLHRVETGELLEDANGLDNIDDATERKGTFPEGTTLEFIAGHEIYSGTTPPDMPTESIWWYHLETCDVKKWIYDPEVDEEGVWVDVTQEDRHDSWVGSSITFGDPHINYLCYSNKDGTQFGLIELI